MILYAIICLFLDMNSSVSGGFSKELQMKCRESALLVRCPIDKSDGTGVVIGRVKSTYYALTAYHVVRNVKLIELDWYSQKTWPQPRLSRLSATLECFDETADLALLKFEVPQGIMIPVSHLAKIDDLDPRKERIAVFSIGCDAGGLPSIREDWTSGKKLLLLKENTPRAFFWETENRTIPGRSGGALYNRDGSIIGICSATQSDLSYYVHIDEICAFCKKKKFDWLLNANYDNINNN
jgi:S1-C subfamily serine protease